MTKIEDLVEKPQHNITSQTVFIWFIVGCVVTTLWFISNALAFDAGRQNAYADIAKQQKVIQTDVLQYEEK